MIPFSPDDPDLDWLALAEHALALGEDELSLDLAKEPDDEIEPEAVRAFDREPPPGENYPDPDD
jgi:hypothetical protein